MIARCSLGSTGASLTHFLNTTTKVMPGGKDKGKEIIRIKFVLLILPQNFLFLEQCTLTLTKTLPAQDMSSRGKKNCMTLC